MKFAGKTLVLVLCAIALGAQAVVTDSSSSDSASGDGSPYSSIWLRNVFDLKAPPPPPDPSEKTNTPPPNVKLTGITTIFGKRQALFMVQDVSSKPPGKEDSYILSEGERQGPLEVVEINPKTCKVKIKNDGVESTITFETNRAPAGPVAQMAGQPNAAVEQLTRRGFGRQPGASGTMPLPITRPIRSDAQGAMQNGGYNGGYGGGYGQQGNQYQQQQSYQLGGGGYGQATTTAGNSGANVNLGNMLGQPGTQQQQEAPVNQGPTLSMEEQVANGILQQVANNQAVKSGTLPAEQTLPPLPAPPGFQELANPGSGGTEPTAPGIPGIPGR